MQQLVVRCRSDSSGKTNQNIQKSGLCGRHLHMRFGVRRAHLDADPWAVQSLNASLQCEVKEEVLFIVPVIES